jgi:acyl-coenzyme A synthetase/AMP-(fatty) acid ligase
MGFIAAGRTVSMIYSFQSPDAIGRDIEKLNLSAIVADEEDWTDAVIAAAKQAGSAGVTLSMRSPTVVPVAGLQRRDETRDHAQPEAGVALQILSSGTTGPPKRQSIQTRVLERTVFSVTSGEAAAPGAPPEFSYWQFGGIGVCQLIAGAYNGRRHQAIGRAARGDPHAARRRRRQGGPGVAGLPDQRVGSARP